MIDRIIVEVPATSANLGPGFDCLGLALSLTNKVEVSRSSKPGMRVIGEGAGNPKIVANKMFLNIFNATYVELNNKQEKFSFTFTNNIPISRGLGSSSVVVLSAIYAAHKMSGVDISKRDLLNKAILHEKHPDNITPAAYGGFCVSMLHKGKVVSIHKSIPKSISALVVIPPKPMSTKVGRSILPPSYSKNDAVFNVTHSSLLVSAFMSNKWDLLSMACEDRFHEKYRLKTYPELMQIKKKLSKFRPLMTTLSGSGSTIFSAFYTQDIKFIKQKVYNSFDSDYRVVFCDFDNEGIRVQSFSN